MYDQMQELKDMRIWLLWRWEVKNGKKTKVPFAAAGGATGTDAKYRHTWVSYDDAVIAAKNVGASGVGFVIPKGYFFLDADHYETDDPFITLLFNRFESYAERSVSGSGIHIYGKCNLDRLPTVTDENGKVRLDKTYYTKNPKNRLELYVGDLTNRFAVFTGNAITEYPLSECTEAVLTTLDKDMRRAEKVRYSEKRDGDKSDFDIICRLRKQKNGEKFSRLYDKGDISGYGSQSEADAALCAMLAFRVGSDSERIDRLFRGSALYRDKWNRDDYRAATIELGINTCHGEFHKSHKTRPYFVIYDEKTEKEHINTPLLAKYVRENLPYILVRNNGKQGLLKYVYDGGCYRLYADSMMLGAIKRFIADYDESLVKMSNVNEVFQHITTDLCFVSQDELNANEDIINFKNGLLHISKESTELLSHTPDIFSTIQIPCEWKGVPSPTPVFDRYMHTLTNGDTAVEQLLLEFIGVCISNIQGWRMKKSLFLVGDGDTGKSQLKTLVEKLLGQDNFIGIDLSEIEARFGTGAIYGTRLAGSSDMSFMSVSELKTFKRITGGDSLFCEFKGQQGFQYVYGGLLWFCMNRLPKFGGDDGSWVYDRIIVVHCPNVIPTDKQDRQLLDKMYAERDGIVYKAVSALQTVIKNGYRFSEPKSVINARRDYKNSNSTVIAFFEECMRSTGNEKINRHCTTGRIFKVYRAWCNENNNGYAKTAKEFREDLAEHIGCSYADMTVRLNGNTYYRDISLTQEAIEQFSKEYGYDPGEFL